MLATIIPVILTLSIFNNTPDFIKEYHECVTKTQELNFINKYQSNKEVNIHAYVISLKMKHAKYKLFPWQKLKVFKTYKNQLEDLITKYPKNIHLRYLRLVIQEKAPNLLNYRAAIEIDKDFLSKILTIKDSTDYLDKYIIKNTSL